MSTHPLQEEPWPRETKGSMTSVQDDEIPTPPQGTSGQDARSPYSRPGWGGSGAGTHLQDPATDVPVTGLALDAKLGVVVRLAVGDTIPLGKGGEGGEQGVGQAGHPLTAAPAPGGTAR